MSPIRMKVEAFYVVSPYMQYGARLLVLNVRAEQPFRIPGLAIIIQTPKLHTHTTCIQRGEIHQLLYGVTWAIKLHPALVPIAKLSFCISKSPAVASLIVKSNRWTKAARSWYISAQARLCGSPERQKMSIRWMKIKRRIRLTACRGKSSFLVRRGHTSRLSLPQQRNLTIDLG